MDLILLFQSIVCFIISISTYLYYRNRWNEKQKKDSLDYYDKYSGKVKVFGGILIFILMGIILFLKSLGFL